MNILLWKKLVQTYWFSGSIAVQNCSKSVGSCRYSESLNQATLTVISVEGRRGWILCVFLQSMQSYLVTCKILGFFSRDRLLPQNCCAEQDRPWLLVCHSNLNMTFSIALCWNSVQKRNCGQSIFFFMIFMCWPSETLKVSSNQPILWFYDFRRVFTVFQTSSADKPSDWVWKVCWS